MRYGTLRRVVALNHLERRRAILDSIWESMTHIVDRMNKLENKYTLDHLTSSPQSIHLNSSPMGGLRHSYPMTSTERAARSTHSSGRSRPT